MYMYYVYITRTLDTNRKSYGRIWDDRGDYLVCLGHALRLQEPYEATESQGSLGIVGIGGE